MPKRTYKIQGYHGGISSDTDPRDIQDIESPSLIDVSIDSVGRIKTLGSVSESDQGVASLTVSNNGLFVFGSDKQLDGGDAQENLIVSWDDGGNTFDVKDSEGWNMAEIGGTVGYGSGNNFNSENIVYYANDGILRIGDADFHSTTGTYNNQWFGYIEGNKFSGLNATTGSLAKPEITSVTCTSDSSDSLNGKYFDIYGAGGKTEVWIDNDNSGTSAPSGSGSYAQTIEVTEVETNDTAEAVAIAVAEAIGDHADFSTEVIGRVVLITDSANASRTNSSDGDTGFIVTTLQEGASSGTTANIGWYLSKQDIESPFGGICIISNPETGTAGNTVNDDTAEYDGTIADNNGTISVNAVNLRVGLQYTSIEANDAANYGTSYAGTGSASNDVTLYPLLGNNNVDIAAGSGSYAYSLVTKSIDYTISEEQSSVVGFYITEAEWNDISKVEIQHTETTSGEHMWNVFTKADIVPDCWNLLVSSLSNIDRGEASGVGLDSWYIWVYDTVSGTPAYTLSGPVIVKNSGLEGFQEGTYTFHYTWLYDERKQESLPSKFWERASAVGLDGSEGSHPNKINVLGGSVLFNFDCYVCPGDASNNYGISKRISGSRLYWKMEGNDDYFLIGELDFEENGFKWLPEGDKMAYVMKNSSNSGDAHLASCALVQGIKPISANIIDTYKNINGYSSSIGSITAKYKTAVVHGRRTYIGNIRQITKNYYNSIWSSKDYPDRIIKSEINKFDVFPENANAIDVVINDGESIVKLEEYADRILQFKQNSMYVINVAENVEFLEDTFRNKGCSYPYHVVKTDFGIAWFNKHGVYFYDGKQVLNLLEKGGMRLISESDWKAFITDGEDGSSDDADMSSAHIAYIPNKRQLLINNENKDVFIYDFVLRAWMKGSSKITTTTKRSNFVLLNEDLIYITQNADTTSDININTWNPDAASSTAFVYQTKDIDFGEPGVRKKIYKVYVTYKTGGATNVQVKYDVDGGTAFNKTFQDGTNFASNELGNAGSGAWTQAILKPSTSSEANNKYSFAIKFTTDGAVPSTFEINDISIVYRTKTVR